MILYSLGTANRFKTPLFYRQSNLLNKCYSGKETKVNLRKLADVQIWIFKKRMRSIKAKIPSAENGTNKFQFWQARKRICLETKLPIDRTIIKTYITPKTVDFI